MNDNLDQLSDDQLNEVFDREVADWRRRLRISSACAEAESLPAGTDREMSRVVEAFTPPPVSTDASLVLPWLEKYHCSIRYELGGGWQVSLLGGFYNMKVFGASGAKFQSFARAACIALIRAARRLEKEA